MFINTEVMSEGGQRARQNVVLILSLLFCLFCHSSVRAQLYSNDFNQSNGSPVANWVPVGSTNSGFWNIDNNRLSSGDMSNTASADLNWYNYSDRDGQSWANYTASVDVRMLQSTGRTGIAFRWIDARNYYFAEIDIFLEPGSSQPTRIVSLNKVIDDRRVQLTVADDNIPSIEDGTSHNLSIQADGPRLSFLIDGSVVAEASDSDHLTGSIALGAGSNQVSFDNLKILPGVSRASTTNRNSGGQAWRVVVLRNVPERAIAEGAKAGLEDSNFSDIQIESSGSDFSLFVGKFNSRSAAQAELDRLEAASFLPITVESFTPSTNVASNQPVATPRPDLPPPLPSPTPSVRASVDQQLQEIEEQARTAESEGKLDQANNYWKDYTNLAPPGQKQDFGLEQQDRIVAKIEVEARRNADPVTLEKEGGSSLIYIIIGVVVLVVIVGIAFFVMSGKKKSAAPKPAAAKKDPSTGLSGVPAPKKTQEDKPAGLEGVTPKPVASKNTGPPKEVSETARIKPGTVSKAPEDDDAEVVVADLEEPSSSVTVPEVRESSSDSNPKPKQTSPKLATPKPQPKSDKTDSGLSLDFLFDENKKEGADQKSSSTEFVVPPQPDSSAEVPTGAVVQGSDDPRMIFAQDFAGIADGSKPEGWSGDYDYASLQVVSDDSRQNGRCLRFEKTEGSGSALYTLNFPDASGRFIVEFDIRCDEKNKYLLGFYIEKDGNFKQSISTIVHRTKSTANPTLRLQNESTSYEFGQWSSIKYDIDLPRHLVDGFVDEKPVLMAARLNQAPKVINSFSIRDNLATTGTLLIRNIKVYRVS